MRIGICGGTFDPFHRGHLEPVLAARQILKWDRIVYVPAWRQPFKVDRDSASGYHRFAMAVMATRAYDSIFVSTIELERGGVSYTVDTLEAMHALHPDADLDWIIGDDNVAQLAQWKDPERLFALARFVALARVAPASLPALPLLVLDTPRVPISSTEIREKVRNGEPIDAFVDPLVSRYIQHNGLYKEAHT